MLLVIFVAGVDDIIPDRDWLQFTDRITANSGRPYGGQVRGPLAPGRLMHTCPPSGTCLNWLQFGLQIAIKVIADRVFSIVPSPLFCFCQHEVAGLSIISSMMLQQQVETASNYPLVPSSNEDANCEGKLPQMNVEWPNVSSLASAVKLHNFAIEALSIDPWFNKFNTFIVMNREFHGDDTSLYIRFISVN